MVMRKRRTVIKRKVVRRRKVARRLNRSYVYRRLGQLIRMTQTGLNTMNFATDGNGTLISSATAADSMTNTLQWGNAYQFKLGSVIDSSDFTALYDKYKITMVKIKIMYQSDSAAVGSTSVLPIFNYCPDYDDSVAPSSLNSVNTKQRARSVVLTANKPITITIRPKVAVPVYQGVLTAYSVAKAPFIDCSYPDVLHYGIKTWINNFATPTGANNQITVQPTYYLSLRDPQ